MARATAKIVVSVVYDTDETNATEVAGALEEQLEHVNDCGMITEVSGFSVTIGRCKVLDEKK